MWEISGQKVLETLTIEKNGLTLDDIEKDGWQDFIKEIIPQGLSQLFFFDGEKIQKMMSDDSNEELKRSILSLLGLDLVERFQADLKIYRSKSLKGGSTESFSKEIAALEGQKELVEADIRKLNDDKASPENSIQQLTVRIADYRDKMSAQGEGYYRNRVIASCKDVTPGERRFARLLEAKREDDYLCWYNVPIGPSRLHPGTGFHRTYKSWSSTL